MFLAALTSRSWTVPQPARPFADAAAACRRPVARTREHIRVVGKNRPIFRERAAVPRGLVLQHGHELRPARVVDRLRQPGAARPSPHKSSTYTAWLSRMIVVESLCCQSRRASATLACALATLTTAFFRFADALLLAGQVLLHPLELAAGAAQELRRGHLRAVGQHREMRQPQVDAAPRESDLRQRLVGGLHDERGEVPPRRIPDHRHRRRARRAGRATTAPPRRRSSAAAAARCRSDPEPGVGGEPDRLPVVLAGPEPGRGDLRPLRLPVIEAKKLRYAVFRSARACCNTTADTSPSHARSGVPLPRSAAGTTPRRQVRLPGLVGPAGAQRVVEHHPRAPERPGQRLLLTRRRVEPEVVPQLHTHSSDFDGRVNATTSTCW